MRVIWSLTIAIMVASMASGVVMDRIAFVAKLLPR